MSEQAVLTRSWQVLACRQGPLAQRSAALRSDSALPAACSQYTPTHAHARTRKHTGPRTYRHGATTAHSPGTYSISF